MTYPFGVWLPILGLSLFTLFFLATVAFSFMAFVATGEALTAKERLVARLAQPLVLLGCCIAWVLLVLFGAAYASIPSLTHEPLRTLFFGMSLTVLLGALVAVLLLMFWKRLPSASRRRNILFCMGVLWLAGLLGGCLLFACWVSGSLAGLSFAGMDALQIFFAVWRNVCGDLTWTQWFMWAGLITGMSLAAGGGLGLVWLIVRRPWDDFGRDYYVHTSRACANWGRGGAWLSLVALVPILADILPSLNEVPGIAARLTELMGQSALWGPHTVARLGLNPLALLGFDTNVFALLPILCTSLLLPVCAGLAWRRVVKSLVPMRHKLAMLFGVLCMIAAIWNLLFILTLFKASSL